MAHKTSMASSLNQHTIGNVINKDELEGSLMTRTSDSGFSFYTAPRSVDETVSNYIIYQHVFLHIVVL